MKMNRIYLNYTMVALFVLSRRKPEQVEKNICFGNISPDVEVRKHTQFVEYSEQSQTGKVTFNNEEEPARFVVKCVLSIAISKKRNCICFVLSDSMTMTSRNLDLLASSHECKLSTFKTREHLACNC